MQRRKNKKSVLFITASRSTRYSGINQGSERLNTIKNKNITETN